MTNDSPAHANRPFMSVSLTVLWSTRIRSVVMPFGSREFFPLWRLVRLNQDGERAERLTNTLFGAIDGGQHRQERALALTSLRCTRRRCALATLATTIWDVDQSVVPGSHLDQIP